MGVIAHVDRVATVGVTAAEYSSLGPTLYGVVGLDVDLIYSTQDNQDRLIVNRTHVISCFY